LNGLTPHLSGDWMQDEKDFQRRIQQIGDLVQELDTIADPEVRTRAKTLVQLILDLHAAGLERALEVIAGNNEFGQRVIDDLGRDSLVSSLLVLYGLHPLDVDVRVARTIEKLIPQVRKGGAELEVESAQNGFVRLRVKVTAHGCGSPTKTLKTLIEDAIYEAAPDISGLQIEGLDAPTSSGFVPLGQLNSMSVSSATPPAVADGDSPSELRLAV